MTSLVEPQLINGPFGDPGLYLDFRFGRRALMFDLGDLTALPARKLLRVSHAFVSHGHMDHFSGFDRLLRVCLGRPRRLMLFGPLGFVAQVAHKLAAYNWNLIARNEIDFVIGTVEFDGVQLGTAAEFHSRDAFTRRDSEVPKTEPGVLLDDEAFRVRAVALDHGIPSLAFAFEEKSRINVWKVRLEQMGLPVGPWLNGLKEAVRRGEPDEAMVVVSWAAADGPRKVTLPLGELKAHALHMEPGRKLAYVVDAAYHEENAARIVELARGAERLFIEAVFLSGDAAIGARRRHLTAAQAGFLARRAAVGRVLPLHFSPRYLDREQELRREVEEAFQGRLDPSVSGRRQREVREPAAP